MDDTFSFLESEINDTKQAIEAATLKLNTLQELLRKYREKHPPTEHNAHVLVVPIKDQANGWHPDSDQDGDNKTQLVLDVILKHHPAGIKAGRVYDLIVSSGISINRNYVYSILNRQKKRGTIQHKRGKYYATLGAFAPTVAGGQKIETASE